MQPYWLDEVSDTSELELDLESVREFLMHKCETSGNSEYWDEYLKVKSMIRDIEVDTYTVGGKNELEV